MNEGDRALDRWLAEHIFGWTNISPNGSGRPPMVRGGYGYIPHDQVPSYTGRCWPQLAEALQDEPHGLKVAIKFLPRIGEMYPKWAEAYIYKPSNWDRAIAHGIADTPGLALGRAAEQALGGAE